jgi:hypothetical protein
VSYSLKDWLDVNDTDPNVHIVEAIAAYLGELCNDVVFVGGCSAGMLLTEMRSQSIRITQDVDVIASVTTLGDYHKLEDQLRDKGFQNDISPHAPICRWIHNQQSGLPVLLDLMPSNPEVLGFANRWYPLAIQTAQAASTELRTYLAHEFKILLSYADFETTLAGHLPPDAASQARLTQLRQKLRNISQLK